MFHSGKGSNSLGRRAPAVGLAAVVCSALGAAAASAATLKIDVPSTVKNGGGYAIKLTGSFTRREVPRRAFLVSVIQYSPQACAPTAQQENNSSLVQFYFGKKGGIFETSSPFVRTDGFTAKRVGRRRVCSYLYAQEVRPSSKTAPVAKASKAYRVTTK